jgi:hypothetical protein
MQQERREVRNAHYLLNPGYSFYRVSPWHSWSLVPSHSLPSYPLTPACSQVPECPSFHTTVGQVTQWLFLGHEDKHTQAWEASELGRAKCLGSRAGTSTDNATPVSFSNLAISPENWLQENLRRPTLPIHP